MSPMASISNNKRTRSIFKSQQEKEKHTYFHEIFYAIHILTRIRKFQRNKKKNFFLSRKHETLIQETKTIHEKEEPISIYISMKTKTKDKKVESFKESSNLTLKEFHFHSVPSSLVTLLGGTPQ